MPIVISQLKIGIYLHFKLNIQFLEIHNLFLVFKFYPINSIKARDGPPKTTKQI